MIYQELVPLLWKNEEDNLFHTALSFPVLNKYSDSGIEMTYDEWIQVLEDYANFNKEK